MKIIATAALLSGALLSLASPVWAQDATDPTTGTDVAAIEEPGTLRTATSVDVLAQCGEIDSTVDIAGGLEAAASSACVERTRDYLATPRAAEAEGGASQSLADFVVELAGVAQQDPECNAIDLQVAEAIRVSADEATDEDQRLQILQIADTIGACEVFETASIAPLASPN